MLLISSKPPSQFGLRTLCLCQDWFDVIRDAALNRDETFPIFMIMMSTESDTTIHNQILQGTEPTAPALLSKMIQTSFLLMILISLDLRRQEASLMVVDDCAGLEIRLNLSMPIEMSCRQTMLTLVPNPLTLLLRAGSLCARPAGLRYI